MALIIKIAGVSSGGDPVKMYGDALVNEGSLLAYDFSNKGCLTQERVDDGAPFYDLAREVSFKKLGIDNNSVMNLSGGNTSLELTSGKGIDYGQLAVNSGSGSNYKGFDLGSDLLNYLNSEQPRLLAVYWARKSVSGNGAIYFLSSSDSPSNLNLEFRSTSSFHIRVAGGASGGVSPGVGEIYQVAVEYNGDGQPMRRFVNGALSGEGSQLPGSFTPDFDTLILGSRFPRTDESNLVFYRGLVYDLNHSELTSEEIVAKDYNYCYGIGEFAGKPTKRPFIDTV